MAAETQADLRDVRGRGAVELLLLAGLYLAYSGVRLLASDDLGAATARAEQVLGLERAIGLDGELALTELFHAVRALEVTASLYYAAAHYVVTAAVLLWLWFRRPADYRPARRALVAATLVALAAYLLVPTAPPRLVGGYHDLLALTSDVGWWSTSASAPQGLGGMTNELAAMPSMHAGWALWCGLVLVTCARTCLVRTLGRGHAVLTAVVVVGTGNHWVLDVVVGAAIVAAAWLLLVPRAEPAAQADPARWVAG